MRKWLFFSAFLLVFLGSVSAWGHPAWKGDLRKIAEADGVVYSLYADRTRFVEDCVPGAEQVAETYVHMVIPGQNLIEILQWNIRLDGREYRVQDSFDYALDTKGLVDQ
jgi:hypothetical protein